MMSLCWAIITLKSIEFQLKKFAPETRHTLPEVNARNERLPDSKPDLKKSALSSIIVYSSSLRSQMLASVGSLPPIAKLTQSQTESGIEKGNLNIWMRGWDFNSSWKLINVFSFPTVPHWLTFCQNIALQDWVNSSGGRVGWRSVLDSSLKLRERASILRHMTCSQGCK